MSDALAPVIAAAAARFGTSRAALHPMEGGHVTRVFEFVRDGKAYVLRILPPSDEFSLADVRAIQAWVLHLAEHGAPVAAPLPDAGGDLVAVIDGAERPYIAVAAEKAPGLRAETLPPACWTDAYFLSLGRTAAHLHTVAAGYKPPPHLRRPDVLSLGDLFGTDQPASPLVSTRKQQVLQNLAALPKPPEHYGMIHGDFHFGNCFVDPENGYKVTVFDFDDCGYGWYMMDTATLLFDIAVLHDGDDADAFITRFLRHYLSGYRQVRPIDPFWLARLPLFLKLLEISYYALLAPAYEGGDDDWWVARFMPGRQARVEGEVPYLNVDPVAILESLG